VSEVEGGLLIWFSIGFKTVSLAMVIDKVFKGYRFSEYGQRN